MKDLKLRTNTNYEEVARAISGLDLGGFFGAVFGGVMIDRYFGYWDLITAIFLNVSAICTFIIPWTTNVNVLWALFFVSGGSAWVQNMSTSTFLLLLFVILF